MALTPILGKRSHSAVSESVETPEESDLSSRSSSAAKRTLKEQSTNTPLTSPNKPNLFTPPNQMGNAIYHIPPKTVKREIHKTAIPFEENNRARAVFGRNIHPISATTASSTKPTVVKEPLFPNPHKIAAGEPLANFTVPQGLLQEARTTLTYIDDKITRNVCKQHSSRDCGSTALLMILMDIVRKTGKSLPITNAFWNWYSTCELATATEIVNIAKKEAGVTLTTHKVPQNAPLAFLKGLIESSNYPVISGISHPQLDGHWIVVDRITDTHSNIRDPSTGRAYKDPNSIMESYYMDEDASEGDEICGVPLEYAFSVSGIAANQLQQKPVS